MFARILTDHGALTFTLSERTHLHSENFAKLAREGFYDDLAVSWLVRGTHFLMGDPTSRHRTPERFSNAGPGYTLPAELRNPDLLHTRGALGAFRDGDAINPERRSHGSQFYVVFGRAVTDAQLDRAEYASGRVYTPEQRAAYRQRGGAPSLDWRFTVFGALTDGWKVLDLLERLPTDVQDRPAQRLCIRVEVND